MGNAGSIPIIFLVGVLALPGILTGRVSGVALPYESNNSVSSFSAVYERDETALMTNKDLRVDLQIECKECKGFKTTMESFYPNKVNLTSPVYPLNCARIALAAAAKSRHWCWQIVQKHGGSWTQGWQCHEKSFMPTVRRCCGEWAPYNHEFYNHNDFPTARERVQTDVENQRYWYTLQYRDIKDRGNTTRMIIHHDPENYNIKDKQCRELKPKSDLELLFWMSKLRPYGVLDADENGKVWGKEMWAPEGPIMPLLNTFHKGSPHYFGYTPEEILQHDLDLLKEGWKGGI